MQLSSMGGQVAYPALSLYHASKWAIEGFFESVAQEVAPFGIGVDARRARRRAHRFRRRQRPVGAAAGRLRRHAGRRLPPRAHGRTRSPRPGRPGEDGRRDHRQRRTDPAPSRLVLGSDSYGIIRQALADRLAVIEPQRDTAAAADGT